MIKQQYTYEHDGHTFPLPFNPDDNEPEHIFISEDKTRAILAFLVRDENPVDPIENYDEGEFYQFDRHKIHYKDKPELDEWKRIIRAHPGFVVSVDCYGDRYKAIKVITVQDTKSSKAEEILDSMDGYYIAPDYVTGATGALQYAKGVIGEYTDFCTGDVFGVIVWEYKREKTSAGAWPEPSRDNEVWGYYGQEYASEELKRVFDSSVTADVT